MPSNKDQTHSGTSRRIEEFLVDNIGKSFTSLEIRKTLGIPTSVAAGYTKINTLINRGCLIKNEDNDKLFIDESILTLTKTGRKRKNGKITPAQFYQQNEIQMPTLTPLGHASVRQLEILRSTQPIDIGETMQQIINITEQNKMYKNAFEQIAILLEQVGIIEKA